MSRLCHTCLLVFDPACVLTMSLNKAMRMDPHISRLSHPVTQIVPSNNFDQTFKYMYMFL